MSRVVLAVVGAYVASAAVASIGAMALPGPPEDAVMFSQMAAFLFYLVIVLWALTTPSLRRVMRMLATTGLLAIAVWLLLVVRGHE